MVSLAGRNIWKLSRSGGTEAGNALNFIGFGAASAPTPGLVGDVLGDLLLEEVEEEDVQIASNLITSHYGANFIERQKVEIHTGTGRQNLLRLRHGKRKKIRHTGREISNNQPAERAKIKT